MIDLQNFEGDLLLADTPDGGNISIENDLFVCDRAFRTAVYLSLFGGNKEDSGKVKNKKTWWGNSIPGVNENEKLVSRFQAGIAGMPMTTKNIQEAENCARLDLRWIIDEGIGNEIEISGSAATRNKFALAVNIRANGESVFKETFTTLWEVGVYDDGI